MVGYVMALLVDKLTGATLLDQQESFLGKLVLHLTVFASEFSSGMVHASFSFETGSCGKLGSEQTVYGTPVS